jgi:hypothetical protein
MEKKGLIVRILDLFSWRVLKPGLGTNYSKMAVKKKYIFFTQLQIVVSWYIFLVEKYCTPYILYRSVMDGYWGAGMKHRKMPASALLMFAQQPQHVLPFHPELTKFFSSFIINRQVIQCLFLAYFSRGSRNISIYTFLLNSIIQILFNFALKFWAE